MHGVAAQDDRYRMMWIMIADEHGCHDAIGQSAVGKVTNLRLATLEAMLTAVEVLEQKALEMAGSNGSCCGERRAAVL